MSSPPTSPDTPSAISLRELAVGLKRCGWPESPMTRPCGRVAALANLTARQAREGGLTTRETYGGPSAGSSTSAALQQSLESRLHQRLGAAGSPEYVLTWKHWDMLSGPPICALRARGRKPKDGLCVTVRESGNPSSSERPTSDSGYSGWGTPLSQHANGEPEAFLDRKRKSIERGSTMGVSLTDLNMQAKAYLAGWPTPMSRDHFPAHTPEYIAEKRALGHGMSNLNDSAQLVGWPTPRMADGEKNVRTAEGAAREIARKGGPQDTAQAATLAGWPTPNAMHGRGGLQTNPEKALERRAQGHMLNLDDAATLAGWPTPQARDHFPAHTPEYIAEKKAQGHGMANLNDSAQLAGWPTTRDHKDGSSVGTAPDNGLLGRVAWQSSAPMAKSGASLNPYFSAWLMGFPPEWIDCRPVKATRSRKASKGG